MNVSLQERSIVLTTHVAQMECAITLVEFVFVTKDTKDTIVKVNIPFLTVVNVFKYFLLLSDKTCIADCNGHGKCKDGKCICDVGYSGPDCSIQGRFLP